MNFQPSLAAKVLEGEKTVTRRLVSDNPRSPWWRDRCSLVLDRDYAVCPGRGKNAIARVEIVGVRCEALGAMARYGVHVEAGREGFADFGAFRDAWSGISGSFDLTVLVWRVEFGLVPGSTPPVERFAGALFERQLNDERWVVVYPMTFGKARLCVGGEDFVDDGWCYESPALAMVAGAVWNGDGDPLDGWHRQISTGRRRRDGDPAQEFVRP